ncbi:hypothetical protein EBZ38_16590, partial [bacterium]|nr:hypothetical protein [bacterium]
PSIYDKLVTGLRAKIAESKKPVSYAQKNQLSVLFQEPLTQLHKPQTLAMLQKPIQQQQAPQGAPRFSAQSRKLVLNNLTETQRIEAGEG